MRNVPRGVAIAAGVGLAVLGLAGAARVAAPDPEAGRARIAAMSADERERLRLLYAEWQKLPAEEQTRLRTLHARLAEDAAGDGALHGTLEAYRLWLRRLSPWQRDELRRETDPAARVELVRRFTAELQQREVEERRGPFAPGEFPWSPGSHPPLPQLSAAEFAAVLRVVEERMNLTPAERDELRGLEGFRRRVELLSIVARREPVPAIGRPAPAPRFPDEATLDAMIAAISNEEIRSRLLAETRIEMRRGLVARLVVGGLFGETMREFERRKPEAEQLRVFWSGLEGPQRDEILTLPPEEARRRLSWMYLAQHRSADDVDFGRLRAIVQRISPMRTGRPGSGLGPGGGPGETRPAFPRGTRPGFGERGPGGAANGPREGSPPPAVGPFPNRPRTAPGEPDAAPKS